jgi:hypothetical protein
MIAEPRAREAAHAHRLAEAPIGGAARFEAA